MRKFPRYVSKAKKYSSICSFVAIYRLPLSDVDFWRFDGRNERFDWVTVFFCELNLQILVSSLNQIMCLTTWNLSDWHRQGLHSSPFELINLNFMLEMAWQRCDIIGSTERDETDVSLLLSHFENVMTVCHVALRHIMRISFSWSDAAWQPFSWHLNRNRQRIRPKMSFRSKSFLAP